MTAAVNRLRMGIRSAWERTLQTWAEATTLERITTIMLGVMVVGGVLMRMRAYDYPDSFTFDEPLFVPPAHRYLLGLQDNNDHPPLFKLFMSIGVLLFGYHAAGWRFPALCFGVQSVILAYWVGKALFRNTRAGLMAAAFVAADGFLLSYSRVGLMDGILTCLLLWCMLGAVYARTWRGVLLTALTVGVAVSVKWNGVIIIIPVIATLLWRNRVPRRTLWAFLVVPPVHLLVWIFSLRITGQPSDLISIWKLVSGLVVHHVEMNKSSNPLTSPWYGWLIFFRPVVIKFTTHGASKFYSTSLGNPVFWLSLDVFLLSFLGYVGWALARRGGGWKVRVGRLTAAVAAQPLAKPVLLLLLSWAIMILPWTKFRTAYSFQHYYLPSYAFGLVLLGGIAAALERKRPKLVFGFVALALAVAIFYMPVWCEFRTSEIAANYRLLFRTWRP